ncbi:PREDICTED: ALK tyrosine kinase receptor-like [Acropora digitifera]|uniref:ALK tyrosine kinase receptor-like n=1 Tax=Acropora digitifera TaxID=70779 RepID=UPI00077A5CB9|nr:PREDICTED: ALK tyrosine kinase receptor-like [Acropora digitifera]XP_015747139.1 PREDICTED: ALK tyrosine kinase receptor-like [Acropora digitifera]
MKILLSSSILFLAITTVRLRLQRAETSRSSTVSITENHVLKGCGIHKQRSYDFPSCAHLCLARSGCASVNYENVRNGMCELNRLPSPTDVVNTNTFIARPGYLFGQLVILPDHKHIFTTLGVRGPNGPTSTAGYQGTSLEDQVILNKGIQIWTIPVTGSYVIEAAGASGGNGAELGGLGAKMTGTFQINQGTRLKILVGQEGARTTAAYLNRPAGGGGGSFVTLLDDTPLIVAGGGGGGGATENFTNGDPGQATSNGSQCGGAQGGGGKVCNASTGQEDFSFFAGGGAGISGNGSSRRWAIAPRSFITGGAGGQWSYSNTGFGGFGGGSFALKFLGGGGGGYSGGGVLGTSKKGTAGGGGSYNVGMNQQNMAGANKGDGKVIITLVAYP